VSDSPKIRDFRVGFGRDSEGSGASSRGPLRIVVLSGVAAQNEYSMRAASPMEPVAIDKLSFDRVMGALGPAFAIKVGDPFTQQVAQEGEPLLVELRWSDLKSMRPDGIFAQVSALRALVEARKVVQRAKEGGIGADDARAELSRILPRPAWTNALAGEVASRADPAPTPAAMPPSLPVPAPAPQPAEPTKAGPRDPVDSLFDKVAVKGEAEEPEVSPPTAVHGLSAIVAAVARGNRGTGRRGAVIGTALERVDRAFGRILNDILQHPEARRLERAWRGLRLLVDRSDARSGVEIDLIAAPKPSVADAMRALSEPGGRNASRAPVDLLVVDHEIGKDEEDARLLLAWAKLAEELHAPLLVNGHPSLLGAERIELLPRAFKGLASGDDPRPAAFRAVAGEDACRWVTVAMNGPLVRAAYSTSSSRLREISFSEDSKDDSSHVFAGPALAIAALCAQSFARTGWPCAIVGPRDGMVADLPVRELDDGGTSFAIPLEAFVDSDTLKEAGRAGIALFGCAANHDGAILARAPALHKTGAGAPSATLADQLFVGRLANAVQQVASALPASVDPIAGARVAQAALGDLFVAPPLSGPEIEAHVRSDGKLEVRVRPRRFAGTSLEEITLMAALGD
jgi:type VI secretion system ImpC/EvpB family protein/type VI secretion system ImpB/VipA family protein